MVGNDIVDLKEASKASNWKRPRYLNKLFTPLEQTYIKNAKQPFVMVWRLWSMKEAGYKLYTQLYPGHFYNPKGFRCYINGRGGSVKFNTFNCLVETKLTLNYIVSEARLNQLKMTSEVIQFNSTEIKKQSEVLKTVVLQNFYQNHICCAQRAIIKDSFGIPKLKVNEHLFSISLTHHGTYGAFAIA